MNKTFLEQQEQEQLQHIHDRTVLHLMSGKRLEIIADGKGENDVELLILYARGLCHYLDMDFDMIYSELKKNTGSSNFLKVFNRYFSNYVEVIDNSISMDELKKLVSEKELRKGTERVLLHLKSKKNEKLRITIKNESDDLLLLMFYAESMAKYLKLNSDKIVYEIWKSGNLENYLKIINKYFSKYVEIDVQIAA